MKTAITLGVVHNAIDFFGILTAIIHIVRRTLGKIVLIDKIVASVVGWVDIDHFDFTQIRLLQQLQYFQIIALDVEVLAVKVAGRSVPAHAVCFYRAQRCRNGRIGR